ncbi:hypothetical protein SAMD00019534_065310 [Acytostelium subglobosum LB1]|uniref:hypothetical protein n=1 Tax=Acytostelium subglobosum LB1 TaxID=1410327 RepID=UPI0006451D35|nr:hypothetical protein SAMD00019534_065310 [Acytostelium subglobosum LB1]GAM23356.1 hypothetical protein SAMD00019534_065310 [Acytostelium subglobosum LB1]|eukprot:XP_012753805.1 hypothetical protein SAMD00019534_065310 [Acytostelium subglobosum LB1]
MNEEGIDNVKFKKPLSHSLQSPLDTSETAAAEVATMSNISSSTMGGLESIFTFMRDGIVSFTFLLTLFILSHFIIHKFIRKKDVYTKLYLPRILCTFCLSVSLAAMMLIPITILSNEILTTFPSNYYLQWLNRELIFSFWNKIFWGANISMFVILPFAYFYYEADAIKGRSRIKDALYVLVLVSAIFIAFVYIVYSIFFEFDGQKISKDYLPFSYSLISTMGTLFVLVCIPKGFNTLTLNSINYSATHSEDELIAANLEMATLRESLENNQLKEKRRIQTETKLRELTQIVQASSHPRGFKHQVFYRIVSAILTVINFIFTGWVVLKVFIHVVKSIFEITPFYTWTSAASTGVDNVYNFLEYSSKLGSFQSLFETAVVIYLMISAFVGFFNLSLFANVRPKMSMTSLRKLIINTAIILFISSSFPVVVRTLEISRFDLMGSYTHTLYLKNETFHLFVRIAFITALVYSYLPFISPKSQTSPLNYILHSLSNKPQAQTKLQQQHASNINTNSNPQQQSSSTLSNSTNSNSTVPMTSTSTSSSSSLSSSLSSSPTTNGVCPPQSGHHILSANQIDPATTPPVTSSGNSSPSHLPTIPMPERTPSSPPTPSHSSRILSLILSSTSTTPVKQQPGSHNKRKTD